MASQYLRELTVGEKFRSIRLSFSRESDRELEAKWVQSVFSKNDQRKYWILVTKHSGMRDALDSLLHIKCLWPGMRLSTIHKVFSMKCDQLFINYVRHIKTIWEFILNDDRSIMANVDHTFVQIVELLCPCVSADDARIIKKKRIGKSLNAHQRRQVTRRLLQINTLIPSFRSLFEDLNYLETLVNTLKKLHRPSASEHSLSSSFQALTNDGAESVDRSLRKLFLYCMRNHHRVHACPHDYGSDDAGISEMDVNEAQLNHFATYAYDQGFTKIWTPAAPLLADGTGYDVKENHSPNLVTNKAGPSVRGRRSGPPRKMAHSDCRGFLWIEYMEAPNDAFGEGLTPFFILKAFYNAFFGSWERPLATAGEDERVFGWENSETGTGVTASTSGYGNPDPRMNYGDPATGANLLSDGVSPAADALTGQYDGLYDGVHGAGNVRQQGRFSRSASPNPDDLFLDDERSPPYLEVQDMGAGHDYGRTNWPREIRESLKRTWQPNAEVDDTHPAGRDNGHQCSCRHWAKRQKLGDRAMIAQDGSIDPWARP